MLPKSYMYIGEEYVSVKKIVCIVCRLIYNIIYAMCIFYVEKKKTLKDA